MVYMVIVEKSRTVVRLWGFDIKQFKSLEGFLESGPQFVLQSYILLRNEKRGTDLTESKLTYFFLNYFSFGHGF